MALLVVNASIGGFESGFTNVGMTRIAPLLTFTFGTKNLVVVVNKLDLF